MNLLLLLYFVVFFGVAFVAKSYFVARRIGKSPLVLPKDDSAYGLVGFYFKLVMVLMFLYLIVGTFWMGLDTFFIGSPFVPMVKYLGIILLAASLLWTIIAQGNMKDSWRIGIDNETKTDLITDGLFKISRNPIFTGMIASLMGLFLVKPNAPTFFFLIFGIVLIQIQVRLEEEFLTNQHGQKYVDYKNRVSRYI